MTDDIESAPFYDERDAGRCPKCGSYDTGFRSGVAAGLDVTVRECEDCGHQWDHT